VPNVPIVGQSGVSEVIFVPVASNF